MRAEIVSLGRTSIVYGTGQVLLRVINLLLLPVFTAYRSPADYGAALVAGCLVVVPLQHGLNLLRDYLRVEYDWSRLVPFGVAFAAFAVGLSWPRDFPLAVEVLMSGAATTALAVLVFRLLTPDERQLLIHVPARWLRSRTITPIP